jgi:hypothetical protein
MLDSGLVVSGRANSGPMASVRRIVLSIAVCSRPRPGPSVMADRAARRGRGRVTQLNRSDTNSLVFRSAGAAPLASAISHPASLV